MAQCTQKINFRLTPEDAAILERAAKVRKVKRAALLREFIRSLEASAA